MRKPIEFAGYPRALAALTPFGPYRAVIAHIVDADTFDVFVDLGFNDYPYRTVRLRGVNCPELNTNEGKAARTYVQGLMPVGTPCLLVTHKDAQTFGRYVADVILEQETGVLDLAEALVRAGHATPSPHRQILDTSTPSE